MQTENRGLVIVLGVLVLVVLLGPLLGGGMMEMDVMGRPGGTGARPWG